MIRYIKLLMLLIEYPIYFIVCGSKQKQIDWKNEELARVGSEKVCIDIKFGQTSKSYTFISGDPSKARNQFKTFGDFMIMRGLKE